MPDLSQLSVQVTLRMRWWVNPAFRLAHCILWVGVKAIRFGMRMNKLGTWCVVRAEHLRAHISEQGVEVVDVK